MRFKDSSIGLQSLNPSLVLALMVVDSVMVKEGHEAVITSLNDAKHSQTSLHYSGSAADIRSRVFSNPQEVLEKCKEALGNNPDLDMIYEGDHFHLEYQPKYRG